QVIRLSEPFFASLSCSLAFFPASLTLIRKIEGSPSGGPLLGFGAGAGLLSDGAGDEDGCGADGPGAAATGAEDGGPSSDGRNAFASCVPPGRPSWSGPVLP